MDDLAADYVKLALALGHHDPDYVDAYYGPPEWKDDERLPLATIRDRAVTLAGELDRAAGRDAGGGDRAAGDRAVYLGRQVRALITRVDMLAGVRMSFDEESLGLYGLTAPNVSEPELSESLAELDDLLPGSGSIAERHVAFTSGYVVPPDRLPHVFDLAIAECRRRTLDRIDLPDGEAFGVEYVTGYSWGAQNWYQGEYRSRILVNTEVDIRVDRVLDLAGHEGYPGHHVAALLMDRELVRERGWLEYTVFPLYCPAALVLEGTAMLAVEVAFPGAERLAFEREVVYPAAGLDPSAAERYDGVRRVVERLGQAANETARQYLDGSITASEAETMLVDYMLLTPEHARIRLKFIEQYRSYIINYSVGLVAVRELLESRGGTSDNPDRRWEIFESLLRSPADAVAAVVQAPPSAG